MKNGTKSELIASASIGKIMKKIRHPSITVIICVIIYKVTMTTEDFD